MRCFNFLLPFGRDEIRKERRKMGNTAARGLIQGRAGPPLLVVFMSGWVFGEGAEPRCYFEAGSYDLLLLLVFFPFSLK